MAASKALTKALASGKSAKIQPAIENERTAALKFVGWLDANPPRACYKRVWELNRASIVDDTKSLAALKKYVTSHNRADLDKASALLEKSGGERVQSSPRPTLSTASPA